MLHHITFLALQTQMEILLKLPVIILQKKMNLWNDQPHSMSKHLVVASINESMEIS